MSAEWAEWPGTEAEKGVFLEAIARQCECVKLMGMIKEVCKPHLLLSPTKENHAYWQHLVYGRRLMRGPEGFEMRKEEFDSTLPHNLQGIKEKLPPYKTGWSS